jgi:uncharacterized protein (DUF2237 family)
MAPLDGNAVFDPGRRPGSYCVSDLKFARHFSGSSTRTKHLPTLMTPSSKHITHPTDLSVATQNLSCDRREDLGRWCSCAGEKGSLVEARVFPGSVEKSGHADDFALLNFARRFFVSFARSRHLPTLMTPSSKHITHPTDLSVASQNLSCDRREDLGRWCSCAWKKESLVEAVVCLGLRTWSRFGVGISEGRILLTKGFRVLPVAVPYSS